MADEVTRPRPEGEEEVQDVQIMLNWRSNPAGLRDIKVSPNIVRHIGTIAENISHSITRFNF